MQCELLLLLFISYFVCVPVDMEEFNMTPCFFSSAEDTSIDLELNQSNVTMRSSAEGWDLCLCLSRIILAHTRDNLHRKYMSDHLPRASD